MRRHSRFCSICVDIACERSVRGEKNRSALKSISVTPTPRYAASCSVVFCNAHSHSAPLHPIFDLLRSALRFDNNFENIHN